MQENTVAIIDRYNDIVQWQIKSPLRRVKVNTRPLLQTTYRMEPFYKLVIKHVKEVRLQPWYSQIFRSGFQLFEEPFHNLSSDVAGLELSPQFPKIFKNRLFILHFKKQIAHQTI